MPGTFPSSFSREYEWLESSFTNYESRSQSGVRQVRAQAGHIWRMGIRTGWVTEADYRSLYAFGIKQRGRFETFTILSDVFKTPLGSPSGTPLANGAAAVGASTVATDGWPALTTVLKAGDLFKFENHKKVYMVTDDATTSAGGAVTLSFMPELVASVADNEAITHTNVPFTVAFSDDLLKIEYSTDAQNGATGRPYAKLQLEMEEVWNV